MKDFSQHGEQEHILKFFGGFRGRFLDLGAYDGVDGSNTRALAQLEWEGVAVEANPVTFQSLCSKAHQRTQCVNAAVMDKPCLVTLQSAGQLSTCMERSIPDKFRNGTFTVAAITPEIIAAKFGDRFDFISLDVEGVDLDVLRVLSPVAEHARLLCIEDSIPFQCFDQEHYNQLRLSASILGFTKVLARTPDDSGTGNTLLAKE